MGFFLLRKWLEWLIDYQNDFSLHFQLIVKSIYQLIVSALLSNNKQCNAKRGCVLGKGERVEKGECENTEGRKPRKTYKDLERPVTTLGGVHPLLCSGVNWFHVCLHFIYCSTCCRHHSGYKAFLDCYCVIVRVAGEEHRGSTSLI